MNKYQEALSRIEDTYYNLDSSMSAYNRFNKDLHLLAGLIDKETPKKPIDVEFGPCGDLMLCCPTCKHGVVPIPTYNGKRCYRKRYYPRCPFCGQLLKGEEENE